MDIATNPAYSNENSQLSASANRSEKTASSYSTFFSKITSRISSSLPFMPYSAKYVRQDQIQNIDRAITKTEPQRLLGLRGDDGLLACRLADGWSTIPEVKENWRTSLASRTILRLNNITVFRKTPSDHSLRSSMIGPNHYFGVLDNTHKFLCRLQINQNEMPLFVKEGGGGEQSLPDANIPACHISTLDSALWLSGKEKDNQPVIGTKAKGTRRQQALTSDVGVLIFGSDAEVLTLPGFPAHQLDLTPFGAKLVKNSQPFKITDSAEDPMDVVTYHFGSNYAKTMVQEREGLFLETHNFTQIMSPVTKDSGGFITLGKWDKGRLQLIGVEVPYGYSIIISKGAIHGDSTFIGSYLMAMTVNHKTMATADVVFLKNQNRKNVMLELSDCFQETSSVCLSSAPSVDDQTIGFNCRSIKPLVVISDGPFKKDFDDDIRSQKKALDQAVRTGSSIIYNPANSAEQYLRDIEA